MNLVPPQGLSQRTSAMTPNAMIPGLSWRAQTLTQMVKKKILKFKKNNWTTLRRTNVKTLAQPSIRKKSSIIFQSKFSLKYIGIRIFCKKGANLKNLKGMDGKTFRGQIWLNLGLMKI